MSVKLKPVSQILFIVLFGIFTSYLFNRFPLQSIFLKILFLFIIGAVFFRFFTYETLLYSTIFLIPYNLYLYDIIGQYTISYLQVLWLLTFLKFIKTDSKYRWKNIFPSITLPVLFFVLFMFLSLLWTQDKVGAFKIALRWSLPVFFLVFGYCSDKKVRKNIIKAIVISGVLLTLITITQWGWGEKLGRIPTRTFNRIVAKSRIIKMAVDHNRVRDEKTNWWRWRERRIRAFGTFANANNLAVFLGFIGLFLFLWIVAKVFYEGVKIYRKNEDLFVRSVILSILCGFLWFFIHAQADNIFINDNIGMLFWLEVGILLSFGGKTCELHKEL